jgi:hypothetical protein
VGGYTAAGRMHKPAKTKTAGLLSEPGRCETYVTALESLLQSDVPEPAFDGGN